jgi:hypothetical protein
VPVQRVTSLCMEDKMYERSQHGFRGPQRRKRWSYYRLVPGVLFVTAVVGGISFSLQDAGASNRTPGQVLATSKAAAASEASLHYVSTTKTSADSVTITGDVSKTEGTQTVVANVNGQTGHVTVVLVGGSAYFEGDEPGLAAFMGLPQTIAVKYANQWISLSPSDTGFSAVASGLTTSSALLQIPISKPLSLRGMSEKSGRRVLAIGGFASGTPEGSTKKVTIPARLYVEVKGRSLPVLYTANRTVDNQKESASVSFSGWGDPISVTTPAGAVPIASLGASPVEA